MQSIQRTIKALTGEMRTLHLCNDLISNKITAAIQYACNKSCFKKGLSTTEMTTAQTVLLCQFYSLVSGDIWFCSMLIDLSKNIEQVHLKYPKLWLTGDFSFDKEDVSKAASNLARMKDLGVFLVPSYLSKAISCLVSKYGINMAPTRIFKEETHNETSENVPMEGVENDVETARTSEEDESPVRKKPQPIRLRKAVEMNDPHSIMVLVAGGADVHQITESGDDLIHLAVTRRLSDATNALLVCGAVADSRFSKDFLTPLHIAVRDNNVDIIRILEKFDTDFNQRSDGGDTMMHIAAVHGSVDAINELINFRVSIISKNHRGETALHAAARKNNALGITALLKLKVPLDIKSDNEETPLDIAVSLGHLEATKALLDFVRLSVPLSGILNNANKYGDALLHAASRKPVIKLLVEYGANINIQSVKGRTPLHILAAKGSVEGATALVELGASTDIIDNDGHSALSIAAKSGHSSIVKLLIASGAKLNAMSNLLDTPLVWALSGGHEDIALMLLSKGADSSLKMNDSAPLHEAARKGLLKAAKVLIASGVPLEDADTSGYTPLGVASKYGKDSVVSLLIQAGADVNAKGFSNETPLLLAIREGHENVTKVLLDKGADPLIANRADSTLPLQLAVKLGRLKIVDILLGTGLNVNTTGKNNSTALHVAAAAGNLSIVQFLLDRGADLGILDDNNHSPLCLASNNNRTAVIDLLKSKGAVA